MALPGFRMPVGSDAVLMACWSSIEVFPSSSNSQSFFQESHSVPAGESIQTW